MVHITGSYEGELRCRAEHGPSGAELITDAPVDNAGKGRCFSPTDLVATALGTCVVTILAIVAERRGVDISPCTFRVEKEMIADPTRRIARLATVVTLPASIDAEERKILERAGRHCPVHASLDERVEAPVTFEYV
jgi:putative redox protein